MLRAWTFARERGADLRDHRARVKDTVVWNIEQGQALSAADVGRAEATRAALYRRAVRFLESYRPADPPPVVQVTPFPLEIPWVRRRSTASRASRTTTGWPVLPHHHDGPARDLVPCGFTPDGLPVGLQIVGRGRHEAAVLRAAAAFERAAPWADRIPPVLTKAPNEG